MEHPTEDLSKDFADEISEMGGPFEGGDVVTKSAAAGVSSPPGLDETGDVVDAMSQIEQAQPGLGAFVPPSEKLKKTAPMSSLKGSPFFFQEWPAEPSGAAPDPRHETQPGVDVHEEHPGPSYPYQAGAARWGVRGVAVGEATDREREKHEHYKELMGLSADDLRDLCRMERCGVPSTKTKMAERLNSLGIRAPPRKPKPKKRVKKKDRSAKATTKKKPPPVAKKKKKKKTKGKARGKKK